MSDYRSDVECLRAENERLTARVAELGAKPKAEKARKIDAVPMRWTMGDSFLAFGGALVLVGVVGFFALCIVICFVATGTLPRPDAVFLRGLGVWSVLALAWCLAFVRRVPR